MVANNRAGNKNNVENFTGDCFLALLRHDCTMVKRIEIKTYIRFKVQQHAKIGLLISGSVIQLNLAASQWLSLLVYLQI